MNFVPKTHTLSNRLKVISLDIPSSSSVTCMVMVKVGSRYEEDPQAGISHFLEHLVFKGTKKYPTSMDLSQAVDSIGAEFNAFTSKEYTGFYVKSAADHLALGLDVLSQLVWHPLLPPKEIEKEKGVIIEEINMREDIPMAKVGESFETLLYGLTHLGRDVIGFKKTVMAVNKPSLVDYLEKWYQPERMIVGVIGGIKQPSATWRTSNQLVEKYFNKPNTANLPNLPNSNPEKLTFVQQKPAINVEYKKTEQAHLCLGVRAFQRNHKDRYVMSILSTILGGNMSSRLFNEVREKRGLAYYIKSDINTYFDNGYLVSQAGTDVNKAAEAIKVILEEYRKVSASAKASADKSKVSEAELKRAKEFLKGKLALALEDSKEICAFFTEDLLLEAKIRQPLEIIREVEKVSLDDVARVAKSIFIPQNLNLAIIGPYKDAGKFEKLLNNF
jgi:predicted Zn-dependent peptidase